MGGKPKTPALFTPLFEPAIIKYGIMAAAVFGEVWRYSQMGKSMCVASRKTIADNLNLTIRTVDKYLALLSSGDEPYIKDLTPDVRNRPHAYVDTGQCRVDSETAMQNLHSGVQELPTESTEMPPDGVQDVHSTVQDLHTGVQTFPQRGANLALEESIKRDTSETSQESSSLDLGDIPPPPARPILLPDQIPKPDPDLGALYSSEILPQIAASMTRATYDQWLAHSVLLGVVDHCAVVQVASDYAVDWCRERLHKAILPPLSGVLRLARQVEIDKVAFVPQPGGT
jgi:hypothetical protein